MINLNNLTILYGEDEIETRNNYVHFLELYFHAVYEASNGQEVLDLFKKNKPDLILLDINMPQIDGLLCAKKIRETNQEIPIIMLTAHSEKDMLLEAIELHLVKYLLKPVQRQQLKETLQKAADSLPKRDKDTIVLKDGLIWHKNKKTLFKNNNEIKLTKKEINLFELLFQKNGSICSNEDIFANVWGDDFDKEFNVSSIKTLVKQLRKKLQNDSIKNLYGLGYKLEI